MSWNAWGTVRFDTAEADLETKRAADGEYGLLWGLPDGEFTQEMREQATTAQGLALDLIASGALGSDGEFSVTLSGHANPGHEPTEGYANDMIAVSVTQLRPPKAE